MPLTDQQAFDTTLAHLRKQRVRSAYGTTCRYRDCGDGSDKSVRMCAVGCLIPNAEYDPKMDARNLSVYRLLEEFPVPTLQGLDKRLLHAMQRAHDAQLGDVTHSPESQAAGLDRWENAMARVASDFKLSYAPPASPA